MDMKLNTTDVLFVVSSSPSPAMFQALRTQGMPPLGVGYIATCLMQANYTTKIIDMSLSDNTITTVLDFLKKSKTNIVGLSCTTETYKSAVRIAKEIKKIDKSMIITFGGPHVSFLYEEALLCNPEIDYIILNEGEISFKKLCDYCIRKEGSLDELKGIAYRINNKVVRAEPEPFIQDLDKLPFPNRDLFPDLRKYAFPATISTSRGCPGQCVFCAASVLSGGKYRMRSARNIVDEFEYLKSLGFNHVLIIDDTMTASINRLDAFLNEMISRQLQMTWYCESRVDVISRDMLIKMKAAGLVHIQFGVESGEQKILDSIKKKITLQQIYDSFRWCQEMGIITSTNLIIGQPEDSLDTIETTLNFGKELALLGARISFTICTPFPGTPLWLYPEKFGIQIVDHDLNHYTTLCPVFNTKHLTTTQIRNEYYRAIKEFHTKT